ASACLLLFAGRHDRRTWLLGIYCLLKATQPPLHMLPAFLLELAPPEALAHLEPADRGLGKLRGDTAAVAPLLDRLLRTGADPFGLSIVGREMKRPEDDWRRRKRYPSAAPPP
ncbi:MAG: hypothetical protein OXQ28_10005, partial [Acidobacteriota bacterium]|nr:hypothetical protein [Acidobacteriota bacterium]